MIMMGDGNDTAIGGHGNDTIDGYNGTNILVGDSALILFYGTKLGSGASPDAENFWGVPKSIEAIHCENGDGDTISGGNGTDYIIGGALGDTIHAHGGADLVFGDHGKVVLYEDPPYKLMHATTSHANCTPGEDSMDLGDGSDIAFGGALGDTIYGGAGSDLLFGDFGVIHLASNASNGNLFGILSIDSLDCSQGGGRNKIYGNTGNGKYLVFLAEPSSLKLLPYKNPCSNQLQTSLLVEVAAATTWRVIPEMIWPLETVHQLFSLAIIS